MAIPPAAESPRRGRDLFTAVVVSVTGGCAVTGGLVGLGVGLAAHPPTAWFAALEVGIPAAIVGVVVATPVAGAVLAVERRRRTRPCVSDAETPGSGRTSTGRS